MRLFAVVAHEAAIAKAFFSAVFDSVNWQLSLFGFS
jgi:hypothetical protein